MKYAWRKASQLGHDLRPLFTVLSISSRVLMISNSNYRDACVSILIYGKGDAAKLDLIVDYYFFSTNIRSKVMG